MKKHYLLLTTTLITAYLLSACSNTAAEITETTETTDDTIKIVTTSFHEYDWVSNILGENPSNIEVSLLLDTGVDLHSYEPSVEDITVISSSDLFIHNGGPSTAWVSEVSVENTFSVMEKLGDAVKNEVAIEGMQSSAHNHAHTEDEHSHDEHTHTEEEHTHDDEHSHEEEHVHEDEEHNHEEEHSHDEHAHTEEAHTHDEEVHTHEEETTHAPHEDEHVWLSLNNAIATCKMLEDEISALDPENEELYTANTNAYVETLEALDEEFEKAILEAPRDTLIFADRFPFLYMMQDYDVNYYAAFQGCSAETEATFETITFLAEKVNEFDINNILIIDNGLVELANTVNSSSEDKDSNILTLNSMQSVKKEELDAGTTYYSVMEENLETLKQALSE